MTYERLNDSPIFNFVHQGENNWQFFLYVQIINKFL